MATVGGIRRAAADRGVVRLRGGKGLKKGTPLVLDLPAYRITNRHIRARAIDDLCAVAACLTLLDRLEAALEGRGCVGILFTRAEEVGFVGRTRLERPDAAIRKHDDDHQPRDVARAAEAHAAGRRADPARRRPRHHVHARRGVELEAAARALARARDRHFRYQRALMDGGGCEATVYVFSGFRTGALCLPLKNYHNHAARRRHGARVRARRRRREPGALDGGIHALLRSPRCAAESVERRLATLWRRSTAGGWRARREGDPVNATRILVHTGEAILPAERGGVPILDHGFLFGDSVYEVVRTANGRPSC